MKKFLGLLVAALFVSSYAFAAKDFTAEVSFSGGEVSFEAALSSGSGLAWNPGDITLGSSEPQWAKATNYFFRCSIFKASRNSQQNRHL